MKRGLIFKKRTERLGVGEGRVMTGEDGKGGEGGGEGGPTDNTNMINTNVNMNKNQQNGGSEKAPVVGGTNVETLPRPGKQVRFNFYIYIC